MVKIPQKIKRLFWSYNIDELDVMKDKKIIVKQILNYGNLDDLRWASKIYKEELSSIIKEIPENEIKLRTRRLIKFLFNVKLSKNTQRSLN